MDITGRFRLGYSQILEYGIHEETLASLFDELGLERDGKTDTGRRQLREGHVETHAPRVTRASEEAAMIRALLAPARPARQQHTSARPMSRSESGRKRPVAADFDLEPDSSIPSEKRFARHPEPSNSLIIDISESESESEEEKNGEAAKDAKNDADMTEHAKIKLKTKEDEIKRMQELIKRLESQKKTRTPTILPQQDRGKGVRAVEASNNQNSKGSDADDVDVEMTGIEPPKGSRLDPSATTVSSHSTAEKENQFKELLVEFKTNQIHERRRQLEEMKRQMLETERELAILESGAGPAVADPTDNREPVPGSNTGVSDILDERNLQIVEPSMSRENGDATMIGEASVAPNVLQTNLPPETRPSPHGLVHEAHNDGITPAPLPEPAQPLPSVPLGTKDTNDKLVTPFYGSRLADLPIQIEAFAPYQTSLRPFRNLRFHPKFLEWYPENGFRTWTFSNKLTNTCILCVFETQGGTCNDETCPSFHFRQIGMTDEEIVLDLGSRVIGNTEQQRDDYLISLLQCVNSMQQENEICTFDAVTRQIVQFRQNFLNDASRIIF